MLDKISSQPITLGCDSIFNILVSVLSNSCSRLLVSELSSMILMATCLPTLTNCYWLSDARLWTLWRSCPCLFGRWTGKYSLVFSCIQAAVPHLPGRCLYFYPSSRSSDIVLYSNVEIIQRNNKTIFIRVTKGWPLPVYPEIFSISIKLRLTVYLYYIFIFSSMQIEFYPSLLIWRSNLCNYFLLKII